MPSLTTPQLPSKQTAVLAVDAGKLRISHDVPLAALGPDVAMVKTAAVAINPVDGKMLAFSPQPGATQGYDFAGTIVALGKDTAPHLKVGDRVCGTVHGMNQNLPDVGAFAEYVAAPSSLLLKIPDEMSFEEGASIGLSLFTAGLGIFQELKVPPRDPARPEFVLVAGGSTATGTRAIQLLKHLGLRPITTCSPANFDLVRRFGAEEVFDYGTLDCAARIREYTKNTLAYALDCVAMAETTMLCYGAIGRAGGRYVTLEPFRESITSTRPTIKASWLLALTVFGSKVNYGGDYIRDSCPEDRAFGEKFTKEMQVLLSKGELPTHPIKVKKGGWEAVIQGVDDIKKQSLSGQKLVFTV